METKTKQPRLLTPEELAAVVKAYRDLHQWSQEQLAAISGLSSRTVQRMENGKPSDLDTRRAIARAFEFEDIDILNKPFEIPTPAEFEEARGKFEREHITLKASEVRSGRDLAGLAERNDADLCSAGFDMNRETSVAFARVVDYVREYRDCHDMYSEVEKVGIHDELQSHLDELHANGVTLRFAERKVALKGPNGEGKPLAMSILYVVAYRAGEEPDEFVTPRNVKFG